MTPPLTHQPRYRARAVRPAGSGTAVLNLSFAAEDMPDEWTMARTTERFGDAGEFEILAPNMPGRDGELWRNRLDADADREWVEFYEDDRLLFTGVVQNKRISRERVQWAGQDGWALLKRAYERGRKWIAAPRDVIEHYTQVRRSLYANDFDGASHGMSVAGTTTATQIGDSAYRFTGTSNDAQAYHALTEPVGTDWRLSLTINGWDPGSPTPGSGASSTFYIQLNSTNGGVSNVAFLYVYLTEDGTTEKIVVGSRFNGIAATFVERKSPAKTATDPATTFVIERQGGVLRAWVGATMLLEMNDEEPNVPDQLNIAASGTSGTTTVGFTLDRIEFTEPAPFLLRGADKGTYRLPGTYPWGGLRRRWFNEVTATSTADRERRAKAFHVAEHTLEDVAEPAAAKPDGIPDLYFAAQMFGAVYLRQDLGNYQFRITGLDDGAKCWVAKTMHGEELLDDWQAGSPRTVGPATRTGIDSDAGWYPVIVHYYQSGGGYGLPQLEFYPPGAYTDPGGTSISSSTWQEIPTTSLSPIGCFDADVSGQSHFNIVQDAARQAGLQLYLEPRALESGEFPGQLIPRERVGQDTAVVLTARDLDTEEPILDPTVTTDSTDQAMTLIGTAAGLAGADSQRPTGEVTNVANLADALFQSEAWVDRSDVVGPESLLGALLSSELALRSSPWVDITGQPEGKPQRSPVWPIDISAAPELMRWRPGDGVRISVPEVGIDDTSPRALMQVTKAFSPDGLQSASVGFRARPRGGATTFSKVVRQVGGTVRNYQGQIIRRGGNWVSSLNIDVGAYSDYAKMLVMPGDKIVRAYLEVAVMSYAAEFYLEVNGTLDSSIQYPAVSPCRLDVTDRIVAAGSADGRFFVRIYNASTATYIFVLDFALSADVIR